MGIIFFIIISRILIETEGRLYSADEIDYKKRNAIVLDISDQKHENIFSPHWCIKVRFIEDSTIAYGIIYDPVLKQQLVYSDEWLDTVSNERVHSKIFKPIYE